MAINHTTLQGRLTRDPELRATQSGVSICSFTLAWSRKIKENETKCFLDCVAWRGTAELVARYFAKGSEMIVEGELSTDTWQDKDGNKRSRNKLTVSSVHFCGSKSSGGRSDAPSYDDMQTGNGFEEIPADLDVDGELPF